MCNEVGIYFTENWLDSELDSLQNAVQTNASISIELVATYAAFVSQIALELGSTLKWGNQERLWMRLAQPNFSVASAEVYDEFVHSLICGKMWYKCQARFRGLPEIQQSQISVPWLKIEMFLG